ncbi:uncharacterized protein DAT39_007949, partial [Clarias magur]
SIVEANHESFNNATVQSRGPAFVNFKSRYENVTYWNAHAGDIVEANDKSFNNTIIQSQGPAYITFKSCHKNVTYWHMLTG